jgi:hypothetical protein
MVVLLVISVLRRHTLVKSTAEPTSMPSTSPSPALFLSSQILCLGGFDVDREFVLGLAAMEWSSTNGEV